MTDTISETGVNAIFLDGPWQGKQKFVQYRRQIQIYKQKPLSFMSVSESITDPEPLEIITYHECYRSVRGHTVLYSTTGEPDDILKFYQVEISFITPEGFK